MARSIRLLLFAWALGWSLLQPRAAGAIERQWRVGAGLGAAALPGSDYSLGPMASAHLGYGLSDAFDAVLELGASHHWLSPPGEPGDTLQLYSAAAGISYKLDVIEWVPYLEILVGYYAASDAPRRDDRAAPAPFAQNEVGASLGLGLDYAHTRSLGFGAQLRYHLFASDPGETHYFTGVIRAEYRWGW
jgi:hypothetical protein